MFQHVESESYWDFWTTNVRWDDFWPCLAVARQGLTPNPSTKLQPTMRSLISPVISWVSSGWTKGAALYQQSNMEGITRSYKALQPTVKSVPGWNMRTSQHLVTSQPPTSWLVFVQVSSTCRLRASTNQRGSRLLVRGVCLRSIPRIFCSFISMF